MKRLTVIFLVALVFGQVACSGVGDAGETSQPEGPAKVSVSASPEKFDSGDRTLVSAKVSGFKVDSVILKVKFPDALKYVTESSAFLVGGVMFDANPTDRITSGSNIYLTYFINRQELGTKSFNSMEVIFELEGRASLSSGTIQADIDLNNDKIKDIKEFDPEDPKFDVQDEVAIQVGSSSSSSSGSSSSSSSSSESSSSE